MHLIFLIAFSTYTQSKEVLVSYKLKKFKIDSIEGSIIYRASKVELSIKKEKCNEHILKSVQHKLENALKDLSAKKPEKDFYTITIDGAPKYDLTSSKSALFFNQFEDEFKSLKIEEQLNCKK